MDLGNKSSSKFSELSKLAIITHPLLQFVLKALIIRFTKT